MARVVKWTVAMGLLGCKRTGEFEVDDDASDEDIEEMVEEQAMQRIEWFWECES